MDGMHDETPEELAGGEWALWDLERSLIHGWLRGIQVIDCRELSTQKEV